MVLTCVSHPHHGFHHVCTAGWDDSGHSERVLPRGIGPLCEHSNDVGVKGGVALLLGWYLATVGSELSTFHLLTCSGNIVGDDPQSAPQH